MNPCLSFGCGGQNRFPFWLGLVNSQPILEPRSSGWIESDVHWGYGLWILILAHGHFGNPRPLKGHTPSPPTRSGAARPIKAKAQKTRLVFQDTTKMQCGRGNDTKCFLLAESCGICNQRELGFVDLICFFSSYFLPAGSVVHRWVLSLTGRNTSSPIVKGPYFCFFVL